jgi:hypothetical protein
MTEKESLSFEAAPWSRCGTESNIGDQEMANGIQRRRESFQHRLPRRRGHREQEVVELNSKVSVRDERNKA